MRGGSVRLACLGALLTLLLCAPAQASQPRIINGHPASAGEHPAQGELLEDGQFICGGTLVSNRYFLTAGHCVGDHPTDSAHYSVRLGNVNRAAGQESAFPGLEPTPPSPEPPPAAPPRSATALFPLAEPPPPQDEPTRLVTLGEGPLWSAGR